MSLLTPHRVQVLTAGTTNDRVGSAVESWDDATSEPAGAFVQPTAGTEVHGPTGTRLEASFLVFLDRPITAEQRLAWRGRTYLVDGVPLDVEDGSGRYHHTEARLKLVEG